MAGRVTCVVALSTHLRGALPHLRGEACHLCGGTISTHLRGELPHLRGHCQSAMLPVYVGVGYINLYAEKHTHTYYALHICTLNVYCLN